MTGSEIGPYRVLDKLGEGGMGEVYRARDPRLSRDVAIKVLPGSLAGDRDRLRRFEQEARAAGQLNHPNILAVYDAGTHEGAPYLVSELLNGQSLQNALLSGPLPLRRAVDYARQIAEGLAAAHEKGIVHRDLKPANLFITRDGRIKILDFGIAKLTAAGDDSDGETVVATVTEPGMIVGTPGYMSPEQVRAAHLDGRSDLFNVGAILFEMLTGRAAFRRTTAAETLAAILKDDPLASGGPAGSPSLTRVISRCLEKAPEARFQSARDLSFALEVLSGTSEVAASVTGRSPLRRRALGFIAVALVLALAIVAATWLTRVDEPSIDARWARAVLTPVTNFPGSEADASISPDGQFIVFLGDQTGEFHVWKTRVGSDDFKDITPDGPDQRNPGNQRSAGFSVDGSEIWLAGGRTTDGLRLVPLLGGPPRVFLHKQAVNVAWSKDGKQLVYFTWEDGDPMTIADATGGNPRLLWVDPKKDHNHFPSWSPDGRWIYFAHGSQAGPVYDVWRIASTGGEPERLTFHNNYVRYVTVIDSHTVLYVAPDEDQSGPWLWALDVDRKVTHRLSGGLERYLSVAATADGRRLVASVANPTATLWSVPILDRVIEERDVKPYPVGPSRALGPRFGKGPVFFLSSSGAKDGLWSYADGKALEIWKGVDGELSAPAAVAPDGDQVAVAPIRNGRRTLTIVSAKGGSHRTLSDRVDVRGASAWSRDGNWIATGGNDDQGPGLFLVPVDGGTPRRIVSGPAYDPVWSPTEDLILYLGQQRAGAPLLAVRPSDRSAVEFPQISIPFGGGGRVRFLPDGRGIIYIQGSLGEQDFWLMDLATKTPRQLTKLGSPAVMFTFDLTADGRQIVFDRLRENSDLRLIDLR